MGYRNNLVRRIVRTTRTALILTAFALSILACTPNVETQPTPTRRAPTVTPPKIPTQPPLIETSESSSDTATEADQDDDREDTAAQQQPPSGGSAPATQPPTLPPAPTATPDITVLINEELEFSGGGGSGIGCQGCCQRDSSIEEPTVLYEDGDELQGYICLHEFEEAATFELTVTDPNGLSNSNKTFAANGNDFIASYAELRKWVGLPSGRWNAQVRAFSSDDQLLLEIGHEFEFTINARSYRGEPRLDIYSGPYGQADLFTFASVCEQPFSISSSATVAGSGFAPDSNFILGIYGGPQVYQTFVTTNRAGAFATTVNVSELSGSGIHFFALYDLTHQTAITNLGDPNCLFID